MDRVDYPESILEWAKSLTKEEAMKFLQGAGILDENGELTEPYRSEW